MLQRLFGILLMVLCCAPIAHAQEPSQKEIRAYLFERYERAPKWDRDGDFTHKDPTAAWVGGKSLEEFVIGGLAPYFQLIVYRATRAMEEEGIQLCITSGFRDKFRQSMIGGRWKGLRPSYHGGNGKGFGHATAVDVVACPEEGKNRGEANIALWRWIDQYGHKFNLCRPYGAYDLPHAGPCNGSEYVSRARVRATYGMLPGDKKIRVAKIKKKKYKNGKKSRVA